MLNRENFSSRENEATKPQVEKKNHQEKSDFERKLHSKNMERAKDMKDRIEALEGVQQTAKLPNGHKIKYNFTDMDGNYVTLHVRRDSFHAGEMGEQERGRDAGKIIPLYHHGYSFDMATTDSKTGDIQIYSVFVGSLDGKTIARSKWKGELPNAEIPTPSGNVKSVVKRGEDVQKLINVFEEFLIDAEDNAKEMIKSQAQKVEISENGLNYVIETKDEGIGTKLKNFLFEPRVKNPNEYYRSLQREKHRKENGE